MEYENSLLGPYYVYRKIGEGGLANVYSAYDLRSETPTTEWMVALKILKPDIRNPIVMMEHEVRIQKRLSESPSCDPYVVCVYGYGTIDDTYIRDEGEIKNLSKLLEGGKPTRIATGSYIATELMDGNLLDLKDIIGGNFFYFHPEFTKALFKHLVLGLVRTHSQGIAHMDIKPENILYRFNGDIEDFIHNSRMSDIQVKYGDWGFSCTSECYIQGTTCFMSPELLKELAIMKEGTISLDFAQANDVFSLGMTILELIQGESSICDKNMQFSNGKITLEQFNEDYKTFYRTPIDFSEESVVSVLQEMVGRMGMRPPAFVVDEML